jgi:hypothetical protein
MQAWPATATVAATILLATQGGAGPSAERATIGPRVIASVFADENASSGSLPVEPDPIDDGSIIVECVGHGGPGTSDEDEHRDRSTARPSDMHSATPPRIPLDPSQCYPPDSLVQRR